VANRPSDDRLVQKVEAGRDAEVVGRDKIITTTTNAKTTNISIFISFLLVGILALGGIAWAINTGWLRGSGNLQQPDESSRSINTRQQ
jgi:hypothetical protein